MMKSRGTTFVVMTHRTSVLAVADKMLVLRDGDGRRPSARGDDVLAALQKAAQQGGRRSAGGGLRFALEQ